VSADVFCSCGHRFDAREDQVGGIVNCPRCGHAVEVPGLRDPLWRLIQLSAVVIWAVGAVFAYRHFGWSAAILVTLAVGIVYGLITLAV